MSDAPSGPRPEAVGRVWALVASVVMVAAFGLAAAGSLFYPFGRDQGIFAWVGDQILAGGVPFLDAWDQKGPATHYTYALVQLVFGRGLWGLRVFDLLAVVATQWVIVGLVRPRAGWFAALTSALIFGGLHYGLNEWNTAQPDAWGGMLALAAIAVLAHPSREARAPSGVGKRSLGVVGPELAAGALIGVATLYKATLAIMLLPPLVYALARPHSGRQQMFVRSFAMGAGFALALGLGLASLAAQGGLEAFWEIQWIFNRLVHGSGEVEYPLGLYLAFLNKFAWRWGLSVPLLAAVAATVSMWRRDRALTLALWTAIGVGGASVIAQDKFFSYHAAPLFGPLAALAGIGAAWVPGRLLGRWRRGKWAAVLVGPALAMALLWVIQPPYNIAGFRTYVFESMAVNDYLARFDRRGFSLPVYSAVADYMRETTSPDEPVLVWGFEPMIAYLADRRPVSRFGFHYPLTSCLWPWLDVSAELKDLCQMYRAEMIAEFQENPPVLVAVAFDDVNNLMLRSSRVELKQFPELHELILKDYVKDITIGNFELWRRTDAERR
jgi:4-amino-4-deoxy-L-arabinose transferase-like glycosyltransferase